MFTLRFDMRSSPEAVASPGGSQVLIAGGGRPQNGGQNRWLRRSRA